MSQHSFFHTTPLSVANIAAAIGAEIFVNIASTRDGSGDAGSDPSVVMINSASPLEDSTPGSLSFIDNPKYTKHLADTRAAAVICSEKLREKVPAGVIALVCSVPYKAYAGALSLLYPTANAPISITGETGISPHAFIGDNVEFEDNVVVEAGAVIGANCSIGRDARILANAVIGQNVQIGRGSVIGPLASVTHAYLGDNVIIHTGVRIGQDGFGFAMGPGGHQKVAQIGRVIIQNNVEVGANTTIDRGSNRDTVIGEGTKIDNLVQIGHNVVIGRHCVIVGLAGIAGSATLGDYVVIAGQAGIVGHITVNDGAQVGGGAGVHRDVAAGEKVIGYPSMPVKDWMKLNMKLKAMITGSNKRGED